MRWWEGRSGGRGVVDLADEDLDGVLQEEQPPGVALLVHRLCHVGAVLHHVTPVLVQERTYRHGT